MHELNIEDYRIWRSSLDNSNLSVSYKNDILKFLKELKEEDSKKTNFNENWFIVGNEKYLPITNLMNRKNNNCELSGVKRIRLHDFRHSCASLLVSKGANITLVAKYLGHSKIDETLYTYSHLFKSDLDSIVDALNNL